MIESLLARASDAAIAMTMFAGFALAGIAVSALSYRLCGRHLATDYADVVGSVEKSIFAFIIFVLALTLAEVRNNFGKADDNVIAEAFAIRQLSQDLDLQPSTRVAREKAALVAYTQSVVDDEWRTLAAVAPALSPVAGARLDELRALVRVDAGDAGRTTQIDRVWSGVNTLDNHRHMRLREATASAPSAFWAVTLVLMLIGVVMTGTARLDRRRAIVLAGYFGALGLVIALILILDRPFRGQTSVAPDPIREVIAQIR